MAGDGFLCKNSNNLVIGANPCIFFLDRVWLPQVFCLSGLAPTIWSKEKKTTDNCSENRKKAVLAKTGLSVQKKTGLVGKEWVGGPKYPVNFPPWPLLSFLVSGLAVPV